MIDEKYIRKILESLETIDRNKILNEIQKEGYRMDGWSQLSKMPIGLLSYGFAKKMVATKILFKKVCLLYFGTADMDKLKDVLDEPS